MVGSIETRWCTCRSTISKTGSDDDPFAEHRTAGIAAERLDAAGFRVTAGIGGTGVAGVLRNGDGPAVLLRADMDAPSYQTLSSFPVTVNDAGLTAGLAGAFDNAVEMEPVMGSEDFGLFGTAAGAPSVFWGIGGSTDGAPGNHSPLSAPQLETVPVGVTALVSAARHVLGG